VIAEPNSSTASETETADDAATSVVSFEASPLSASELYQLTLYKWRYSLEAFGFDQQQVRELMFLKWLHASRRVQG
jgi:hypothetical protein